MMSPNSEKCWVTPPFPFPISISIEQSLPHMLCSELLLIATLLPTFELVRRNVVRGPSGPLQQILAAVLSFQARCKYCDTRSPPPNSRGH